MIGLSHEVGTGRLARSKGTAARRGLSEVLLRKITNRVSLRHPLYVVIFGAITSGAAPIFPKRDRRRPPEIGTAPVAGSENERAAQGRRWRSQGRRRNLAASLYWATRRVHRRPEHCLGDGRSPHRPRPPRRGLRRHMLAVSVITGLVAFIVGTTPALYVPIFSTAEVGRHPGAARLRVLLLLSPSGRKRPA